MSECNITTKSSKQSFENHEFDYDKPSTPLDVDTQINNYVIRLHEALDINELFDVFVTEFRKAVTCGSIEYIETDTKISLIDGVVEHQRCNYALQYKEQSLGSISITRNSIFLEHEIENMEVMLAGLTLPLRNALRYKKVVDSAQRDELTGLRNGSYYSDVIGLEIKRAQRYKKPFSLLIFDVDYLEGINNQHGHATGDAVLVEIARRMEQKARSSDIVYRNTGDEFLVFLPDTENTEAIKAAERIKDFVSDKKWVYKDNVMVFTVSVGVTTVTYEDTANLLMDRASKSLMKEKMLGKDCIYGEILSENNQVRYL